LEYLQGCLSCSLHFCSRSGLLHPRRININPIKRHRSAVTRNAGIYADPSHAKAEGGPSMWFAKIPKAPQATQTTPSTKQIHCPITAALEGVKSFGSSLVVLSDFCFAFSGCL
jgi:hypothetical protein